MEGKLHRDQKEIDDPKETLMIDLDSPLLDRNKDRFFGKMKDSAFLSSALLLTHNRPATDSFFWWDYLVTMLAVMTWVFSSAYFLSYKNTEFAKKIIAPSKNQPAPSNHTLLACKHFLVENDPSTHATVSSLGYLVGFTAVMAGAFAARNYLEPYFENPTVLGGLATACGVITSAQSQLFIKDRKNALQNIISCLVVLLSIWLILFYLS